MNSKAHFSGTIIVSICEDEGLEARGAMDRMRKEDFTGKANG
jgi:hypothetical protein